MPTKPGILTTMTLAATLSLSTHASVTGDHLVSTFVNINGANGFLDAQVIPFSGAGAPDFTTTVQDFDFSLDWIDGDTFAFRFVRDGDTPGLTVQLTELEFSPMGTVVTGASLVGVSGDPVDDIDFGLIESPFDYQAYADNPIGPDFSTGVDFVSVSFTGVYPDGLNGDQLAWIVDIETSRPPVAGVALPATLPLAGLALFLTVSVRRFRTRR